MPWDSLVFDADLPDSAAPFRRPSQERGVVKFESLLDAAHALITEKGVNNFSLADVASRAGVATGSAYHFFPNLEAVFIALVERYDQSFTELVTAPLNRSEVRSWHDIIEIHFEKARDYINDNPPALILIIGPGRTWQSKQADTVGDSHIAVGMLETISEFFEVPPHPPPAQLLHLGIRILEGLWELSVQRHGRVTKAYSEETTKAVVAYLRLYWPEFMEPREFGVSKTNGPASSR